MCADAAIASYLLTATPPPDGTTCATDAVPFTEPAAAARAVPRTDLAPEVSLP